ncbi:MAG: phage terminase large subunit family protein, partial [Candidatus Omnitrophota bacterium]
MWRTDRTPYLRGIMDAFISPLIEKITIKASTQVGKTEAMYNMLAYAIDQDPGPALLVMPREPDAKTVSRRRIRPMIEISQALRSHITSDQDDVTKMEIALDRMILYFAGANSPAALSQKPVRYLFMDETDKYPHFSGEE